MAGMARRNGVATIASLETQVSGLADDYHGLSRRLDGLDSKIDSGLKAMSSDFNSALSGLGNKLDERNRPQWQALGVMLSAAIVIGGLAYWPISAATSDMKQVLSDRGKEWTTLLTRLPEQFVNYREHDRLMGQIATENRLVREEMVTRGEHVEHWKSTDTRIKAVEDDARSRLDALSANIRTGTEGVRRELDDVKRAQAEIYGAKDVIRDLRKDQDGIWDYLRRRNDK